MHLGGWTRLFIVVSVFWTLLVLSAFVFVRRSDSAAVSPDDRFNPLTLPPDQFEAFVSSNTPQASATASTDLTQMTRKELVDWLHSTGPESSEPKQQFDRSPTNREFRSDRPRATEPHQKHVTFYPAFLLMWLVPLFGLYIVGHSAGWVIRGFKQGRQFKT
jgi:hypothetical protein